MSKRFRLEGLENSSVTGASTVVTCQTIVGVITFLNILVSLYLGYIASIQVEFSENYFNGNITENVTHDWIAGIVVTIYGLGITSLIYYIASLFIGMARDAIYTREIALRQYNLIADKLEAE